MSVKLVTVVKGISSAAMYFSIDAAQPNQLLGSAAIKGIDGIPRKPMDSERDRNYIPTGSVAQMLARMIDQPICWQYI